MTSLLQNMATIEHDITTVHDIYLRVPEGGGGWGVGYLGSGGRSYLGRKRIMMSPSPVAAAAPAELSAYAPAPAMGESPTRLETAQG